MSLAICILLAAGAAGGDTKALDTLAAAANLDAWQRIEAPTVFTKDNVFDLIDGEAELYFPYGFKRVADLRYQKNNDANTAMGAEVYEMGSLLDAFGIYSNYRDTESKVIALGAEGFQGSTQVMFYQDRYFVKVSARKPSAAPGDVLDCAKAISKVLPQNTQKPKELDLLKVAGVVPQTEQYIGQSLLGYQFFPRGMIAKVKTGDKEARVFVVLEDYDAPDEIVMSYLDYLKKRQAVVQKGADRVVSAVDPLHKGTVVQEADPYVIGVTDLDTPEQGLPVLKTLREKVK